VKEIAQNFHFQKPEFLQMVRLECFAFLTRSQLNIFQMVCSQWKEEIKGGFRILARLFPSSLSITQEQYPLDWKRYKVQAHSNCTDLASRLVGHRLFPHADGGKSMDIWLDMRSASGETSTSLSVGIFSPLSVATGCSVPWASFARSTWPCCAERATEKNRSIGTALSARPSSRPYRGRCPATARALPCRTSRWRGSIPARR